MADNRNGWRGAAGFELTPETHRIVSEIMRRRGARCTPQEFQTSVNVTFHNFESQSYDKEHTNMWDSLPRQFALLVDDYLQRYPDTKSLRLLDIGAGTGLASDCLLGTRIGPRIKTVDLLDTSPAMLDRALQRAVNWKVPVKSHLGLIDGLPPERTYECILSCSVLHHIPNLQNFCYQVRQHQAPGGLFLHLQDPNGNIPENSELTRRSTKLGKIREQGKLTRFAPNRILGRIFRELTGRQRENYISKTNRALLDAGVVSTPLTVTELYTITDIHVNDGHGISISQMQNWLPGYECLSHRTYGFLGALWSELPPDLRIMEEQLSSINDLNGAFVAAAWRLKSSD